MGRLRCWLIMTSVATGLRAASPLAMAAPDWSSLNRYQRSITRAEFEDKIAALYCPSGALTNYLTFARDSVAVYSTTAKAPPALFTLHFATTVPPASGWLPSIHRIALDPGHIGGEWARMEERYFVAGPHDRPVQEAVLNLTVARLLQSRLEAMGAKVFLTKNNLEPVTDKRPADFHAQAARDVAKLADRFALFPPLDRAAATADAVRQREQILFYRSAEITARAGRINEQIKPDLTLCLHFNAVDWNHCRDLVDDNRLTVFVHGNYLPAELADDDQKFQLFAKLLERSAGTEQAVAVALADALARATKLPPLPASENSIATGANPFVLARNLAANRLYRGPVVYLEPYYQNNRIDYQRIQLGDYDGEKEIAGQKYRSIFREYADAVAAGLAVFLGRSTPAR